MKKVIIITRKGEYGSQNRFSEAISSMKCATKSNFSNEKIADLLAKKKWKDAKGNEDDEEKACNLLNLDYDAYVKALEKSESYAETVVISELKNRLLNSMSFPYAYFETSEYEVVLVLIDNLQIESRQAIPNIKEFMNCIKSDCNIEGDDNILYIHDTQLNGSTIDDVTIYHKENGQVKVDLISGADVTSDFYSLKSLLSTYNFIAVFRHLPNKSSYFQSQILSMKFGQPNLLDNLVTIEGKMNEKTNINVIQKEINKLVEEWNKNSSQ